MSPTPPDIPLDRWASHLAQLADAALSAAPAGAPDAFLIWLRAAPPAPAPAGAALDDALWWALLDPAIDPPVDPHADGPLFAQSTSQTIEVWTERELSGLHALSRHPAATPGSALSGRLRRAAAWHTAHTQPDNATNHPWGAHLFLFLAAAHGNDAARLYAETLVHNCQTAHGVPDALSGLILKDAARALRGPSPV